MLVYSEQDIQAIWSLPCLPCKGLLFELLGRCSDCHLDGHLVGSCPGIKCFDCHQKGSLCHDCFQPTVNEVLAQKLSLKCFGCSGPGHTLRHCLFKLRCDICNVLGHRAKDCLREDKDLLRKIWVPKTGIETW